MKRDWGKAALGKQWNAGLEGCGVTAQFSRIVSVLETFTEHPTQELCSAQVYVPFAILPYLIFPKCDST
jgi:hypothetical protein